MAKAKFEIGDRVRLIDHPDVHAIVVGIWTDRAGLTKYDAEWLDNDKKITDLYFTADELTALEA